MEFGVGGTPLHRAAWCGHVSTVKAMLKAGCPVDMVASNGGTVLHFAARGGSVEMIREVLSAGCNISATTTNGWTPLHWAAKEGKTEAALELIILGANKSIVAGGRGTPLHLAALHGHFSTVKALIKAGCPADVVDSNGFSVLHAAAESGSAEVIREVLSTGCDINATCINGGTPLHWAAEEGKTEAALELIRCGANKAIVAGKWGTPLHHAVLHGHVTTVKAMLKAGCPVDVVDGNGATVLHAATQASNVEVVREVLSTGCDVNAIDNHGQTPLILAATMWNTKLALELIRHGANCSLVHNERLTPLHEAAWFSDVSSVKAMIKAGCPVDAVTINGLTVLHAAAVGGNVEVIREVLNTGCDINVTDNHGRTPLHLAAIAGNTNAVLQLIRHGADRAVVGGRERETPLHRAALHGHVSTVKALLMAGCPVDVVDRSGSLVLHNAVEGGNVEVIKKVLNTGCGINATDNSGATPLHVAAMCGNEAALKELFRCGTIQELGLNNTDVSGMTPLHRAVESQSKDCVRILLEHGADPRKAAPYFGSPYIYATTSVPAVVEVFNNYIEKEDERLPRMYEALRDSWLSERLHELKLDRHSSLEKDTYGMSRLEYMLVPIAAANEEVVSHFHNLPLVKLENLLLLAAIHGLNTFVNTLISIATHFPTFAAQTVISFVKMHYPVEALLNLQELVPPDASLNLLHVAVLALKVRTNCENIFNSRHGNHSSLLKSLVTSVSFRQTLHEYLPNGLTPLDLAEKLELDEAATIISSAGGRHGIYTLISEEVRLQHGPALLLAHQELMKVASSGALGQQAVQTVFSQLPGRTTVEQGTATEESYIRQQKVLNQRPDSSVIVTALLSKVDFSTWEETGIVLQVPTSTLLFLDQSQFRLRDRYRKVLQYWLDHDEAASWRKLLEVLGHFETKQTMDQVTQEVLASQVSAVSCMVMSFASEFVFS